MKTEILEKAEDLGLTIVETTDSGNGYPSNLKNVITGFEDFESAQEFAEEYGLEIIELKRKAGQQLWNRAGRMYKPFYMPYVYSCDPCYTMYFCGDESRFTEMVKEQIAELNDFALIKDFIEDMEEIWDEFPCLGENEFILVKDGKFDEVMEKEKIRYEYDSTYHTIGLL